MPIMIYALSTEGSKVWLDNNSNKDSILVLLPSGLQLKKKKKTFPFYFLRKFFYLLFDLLVYHISRRWTSSTNYHLLVIFIIYNIRIRDSLLILFNPTNTLFATLKYGQVFYKLPPFGYLSLYIYWISLIEYFELLDFHSNTYHYLRDYLSRWTHTESTST